MTDAYVTMSPDFTVAPVDRRLFGSFVEHLGRAVYTGIYEPGHPSADEHGFRGDVLELVRELGVSTIRYPGGNFVSAYRWEDGVGSREERPRRLDLAWHSTETNEVGLHEFARWAELAGSDVMMAVNLGTRGVEEALDLLEYTAVPAGTALSDARIANGRIEPFRFRMWCLGNEMDGPWQVGHRSASEYASLAAQAAKAMKQLDPGIELVVCGSSSSQMPTFGTWERTVLEQTFDDVEYISAHAYYEVRGDDFASFLASSVDMDRFIDAVASTADHVAAVRQSRKRIQISFDEWNVWYNDHFENEEKLTDPDVWPVAPRLLENTYTVADAVVVGGLLISLLRHADRVTSASLAQLVNVIAPIMTEPGGPAWRQTIFYPFATTSRLARGIALDVRVRCAQVPTERFGPVPVVDVVATHDPDAGRAAVFLVNRSLDDVQEVAIDVSGFGPVAVVEAVVLADENLLATNTLHDPERVNLRDLPATLRDGTLFVTLPPASWAAVGLG